MKNGTTQTVEGVEYTSLTSLAKAYGLKYSTVHKRYQRGSRGDDLIPIKYRKNYVHTSDENNLKFVVGNRRFKNAAEACRQLKIDCNKYYGRIWQGWSPEEALELVPRVDKRTLRNKANQDSAAKSQIRKRRNSNQPLILFGKQYNSYKEISEAFGIKEYVLTQRVNAYGKTLEEAVLMDGKSKRLKFGNAEYDSGASFARAVGLEPKTFYSLKKRYTLKQIAGIEEKMTANSIVYKGKLYPSKVALAEDFGITKNELYYRTYVCNLSLEEALSIPSKASVVEKAFGKNAKLYIVEIIGQTVVANYETKLYKVGITQHDLSKRLNELPFECKTIYCKNGELNQLKELEKQVKVRLKDKRFMDYTASDFDGFTEVFSLNESELKELQFLIKFDLLSSESVAENELALQ